MHDKFVLGILITKSILIGYFMKNRGLDMSPTGDDGKK